MTKLNFGLIILGILGLVLALAFPFMEEPIRMKLLDVGKLGGGSHVALVLGGLVVGAAMGAFNLFVKPARWTAIVALIAFGIVGMKMTGGGDGVKMGLGATGPMIAAFLGVVLSLVLAVKPGKA